MKFKFDENLPSELGDLLRAEGHDAHSVLDENLRRDKGQTDYWIQITCVCRARLRAVRMAARVRTGAFCL